MEVVHLLGPAKALVVRWSRATFMAISPWPFADLSLIPNPESSRLRLRPPSQPPCPPICVSPHVDGFVVNSTADLIEQRLKKKMTNWWKYSSPTRCTPRPQKAPGPHFGNHCVNHLIYLCTVSHPFVFGGSIHDICCTCSSSSSPSVRRCTHRHINKWAWPRRLMG